MLVVRRRKVTRKRRRGAQTSTGQRAAAIRPAP